MLADILALLQLFITSAGAIQKLFPNASNGIANAAADAAKADLVVSTVNAMIPAVVPNLAPVNNAVHPTVQAFINAAPEIISSIGAVQTALGATAVTGLVDSTGAAVSTGVATPAPVAPVAIAPATTAPVAIAPATVPSGQVAVTVTTQTPDLTKPAPVPTGPGDLAGLIALHVYNQAMGAAQVAGQVASGTAHVDSSQS